MKALLALALFASTAAHAAPETRCGWIDNPTPANLWITDAAGEWIISVQGGYSAVGDITWPGEGQDSVETNGSYGYFCGCVNATTNHSERKIVKILSARVLPLARCLADRKLPQGYKPRKQIHSNGGAHTECLDSQEQQIGFRGRPACVNEAGDYYFLAD